MAAGGGGGSGGGRFGGGIESVPRLSRANQTGTVPPSSATFSGQRLFISTSL